MAANGESLVSRAASKMRSDDSCRFHGRRVYCGLFVRGPRVQLQYEPALSSLGTQLPPSRVRSSCRQAHETRMPRAKRSIQREISRQIWDWLYIRFGAGTSALLLIKFPKNKCNTNAIFAHFLRWQLTWREGMFEKLGIWVMRDITDTTGRCALWKFGSGGFF